MKIQLRQSRFGEILRFMGSVRLFTEKNCEKTETKTRGEVSSLIAKNNDVIPNMEV